MALVIAPSRISGIPESIKVAVSRLQPDEQELFAREYERKKKSKVLMVLLSIFFPIQLFLLGKPGLGIAFWLTLGGFGIWVLIEPFLTPGRVDEYNSDVAIKIMTYMKMVETNEPTPANNPPMSAPMPQLATAKAMTNVPAPAVAIVTAAPAVKRTVTYEPIVGVETAVLVKRAFLFLEDGDFEEADRYLEQSLNQDPENAKTYIGKLLVELGLREEKDLAQHGSPLDSFKNYQKALRFASEDYKSVLVGYNRQILDNAEKEAEQKRIDEEALRIKAEEEERVKRIKAEEERINAENLRAKSEQERKSRVYDEAVSAKRTSKNSADYRSVAYKFKNLGSFRDAEALVDECNELAKKAQTVEEEERVAEEERRALQRDKKHKIISLLVGIVLVGYLGFTAFHVSEREKFRYICENGTAQQVESAIKAGANINAKSDGETALTWAAKRNTNPEVITMLIKAGADVNAKTQYGYTTLMFAAQSNPNPDVIATLIKEGTNVNAVNILNRTALIFAARDNSSPEVITALIKARADVNAKDDDSKTALDYAKENAKLAGTEAYKMLEKMTRKSK